MVVHTCHCCYILDSAVYQSWIHFHIYFGESVKKLYAALFLELFHRKFKNVTYFWENVLVDSNILTHAELDNLRVDKKRWKSKYYKKNCQCCVNIGNFGSNQIVSYYSILCETSPTTQNFPVLIQGRDCVSIRKCGICCSVVNNGLDSRLFWSESLYILAIMAHQVSTGRIQHLAYNTNHKTVKTT